jgi:uncharacterized protein YggU (UPF0235/DUF167 family)
MYVRVKVHTSAKRETLKEISHDHLEIAVRQEPRQNLANRRVIELVAAHLRIPVKKVRITSGHHSRSKILSVS